MREELMKELSNANKTLQKYEDKLLKGEVPEDEKKFFMERVKFWSDTVTELRREIFQRQQSVDVGSPPNIGRPSASPDL